MVQNLKNTSHTDLIQYPGRSTLPTIAENRNIIKLNLHRPGNPV